MNPKDLILDSSVLIAYLHNEKGAQENEKLIRTCQIPFVCLSELYYVIFLYKGKAQADEI